MAAAPARTPGPIVDRLHADLKAAIALPATQKQIALLGMIPIDSPPVAEMPHTSIARSPAGPASSSRRGSPERNERAGGGLKCLHDLGDQGDVLDQPGLAAAGRFLSRAYAFTGDSLARAIAATFARRKTSLHRLVRSGDAGAGGVVYVPSPWR